MYIDHHVNHTLFCVDFYETLIISTYFRKILKYKTPWIIPVSHFCLWLSRLKGVALDKRLLTAYEYPVLASQITRYASLIKVVCQCCKRNNRC